LENDISFLFHGFYSFKVKVLILHRGFKNRKLTERYRHRERGALGGGKQGMVGRGVAVEG
jgi:hypothetical protein